MQCPPPADEGPFNIAFGTVLYVGLFCSYLPQEMKFISRRSSSGVSWVMVLVSAVSNYCTLLNVVMLRYVTLQCCSAYSHRDCYVAWIPILQLSLPGIHSVIVYSLWLLVYDINEPGSSVRELRFAFFSFIAFAAVFLVALTAASFVLATNDSPTAVPLAKALGIIAAVTNIVQWTPQIVATVRRGTAGSLSLLTLLIQAPGGYLVSFFNAIVDPSSWTTWVPSFVSATQQLALAIILIVFWIRERRKAKLEQGSEKTKEKTQAESGKGNDNDEEADEKTRLIQ